MGRVNPSDAYGTGTYYYTEYDSQNTQWLLFKKISGHVHPDRRLYAV